MHLVLVGCRYDFVLFHAGTYMHCLRMQISECLVFDGCCNINIVFKEKERRILQPCFAKWKNQNLKETLIVVYISSTWFTFNILNCVLVNYKKNYDCIVYLISIISNIYRSGGGFLKETKSNLQSKVDDLYPAYDRNWIQVASYFTTVYRCTFVQCCRHNYFYQKYNFVQ